MNYLQLIFRIIIPIIIFGLIVLQPIEIAHNAETNQTYVHQIDKNYNPGFREYLIEIFERPLNLNWYNVCFENLNTTVEHTDWILGYNVTWDINFDDKENFTLGIGEHYCTKAIKSDTYFRYTWTAKIVAFIPDGVPPILQQINVKTNSNIYATPSIESVLIMLTVFLLAGNVLVNQALDIKDKVIKRNFKHPVSKPKKVISQHSKPKPP